jgi:hypothetical protein
MSPILRRVLQAEMSEAKGGIPENEWPRERPNFGRMQIRSENQIQSACA